MIKFESLPNEILIEFFEYFDGLEIFYTFDQFNSRFTTLIRTIPFKLNFTNIHKSICDQFHKTLSNSSIQQQIYSLKLSNTDTYYQINKCLSLFSLEQFLNLRSLTLIRVQKTNLEQLKSLLPLLPHLSSFHLIDRKYGVREILSCLSISKLKTSTASDIFFDLTTFDQNLSIENLTLSCSSWNILLQLLNYTPKLKYLNIQMNTIFHSNNIGFRNAHSLQLKTLIVTNLTDSFENFEDFLKYITPATQVLIITTEDRLDVINASKWEYLITSSLQQLISFQFKFACSKSIKDDYILYKFRQFQTDFWYKQHQWYPEYSLSKSSAVIYTIPYLSKTYTVAPAINILSHRSMNSKQRFINITDLVLFQSAVIYDDQYYFPNVESLTLDNVFIYGKTNLDLFEEKHFECLKRLVNLYNIKHLTITRNCQIENTKILLKIFEQAKQLSSLQIDSNILQDFYSDSQFCLDLKTTIKSLDLYKYDDVLFNSSQEIDLFCEIFSNLEQLKCNRIELDHLFVLLTRLSKLSYMKMYISSYVYLESIRSFLEEQASKWDLVFDIQQQNIYRYEKLVSIWISRNIC